MNPGSLTLVTEELEHNQKKNIEHYQVIAKTKNCIDYELGISCSLQPAAVMAF